MLPKNLHQRKKLFANVYIMISISVLEVKMTSGGMNWPESTILGLKIIYVYA